MVCVALFRVAMEARQSEFVAWLQDVASSEAMMSILDVVLALQLHHRSTALLPEPPGCFVGARKFTKSRDIGMGVN